MSSFNDEILCPNCGAKISEYTFTAPDFSGVIAQCHCCGFERNTVQRQMNLHELNNYRKEYAEAMNISLPPLPDLPSFKEEVRR
jgi:hypothetical protein